jgi:hypothetical protein
MERFPCAECRAIFRDLWEAHRAANGAGPDQPPPELEEWIAQLNLYDCAGIRATSNLWKAWRRLQAHRTLTGHNVSVLPIPPDGFSSSN